MPGKNYLPINDTELQAWLTNFVTVLNANLAAVSLITGLDAKTMARGRQELAEGLSTCPEDRTRQPGGGRPLSETTTTR